MSTQPRNPYRRGERWLWFFLILVIGASIAGGVNIVRRWPRPSAIIVYPPPVGIEAQLPASTPATQINATISIMVNGAVQHPGLYSLPAGATINDAIASAGGLTDAADASNLYLPEVLTDGAVVHIPTL